MIMGKKKLKQLNISSIFTNKAYGYSVVASPLKPIEYIEKITSFIEQKKPIRLIIVGDGLNINELYNITAFDYEQAFGEMDEYYYTLQLSEYREYAVKKLVVSDNKEVVTEQETRQEDKPKPKTYTVVKGDSLWAIAKKMYGDGSKWGDIAKANPDIKNPNLIYPNQVLNIP